MNFGVDLRWNTRVRFRFRGKGWAHSDLSLHAPRVFNCVPLALPSPPSTGARGNAAPLGSSLDSWLFSLHAPRLTLHDLPHAFIAAKSLLRLSLASPKSIMHLGS
jgi:hypothetical protein